MQAARNCGVGLWADGMNLVIVEPWLSVLHEDVLEQLRQHAGGVIAELRGQSRARGGWLVFDPPGTAKRAGEG
jgi:hypothetical protein